MKKFTKQEIRDLFNQVMEEEISFTRMVEVINERVSEASKPKFKKGDKVRIKHGISSKTHRGEQPYFMGGMDELIEKELTVDVCANGIESEVSFRNKDQSGFDWKNAIKFESKEQYERFIKGEI